MKRISIVLALVLCLVLCVFCFASCSKKGGKSTEASNTTADTTGGSGTTATTATTAPTQPECQHVPENNYTPRTAPTCITEGEEILYCAYCGEILDTRKIPEDPEAHQMNWTTVVEPTLLEPVGHRSGVCIICEEPKEEDLNWEIQTYSSLSPSGKYADGSAFRVHKSVADIRGEDNFCPTEGNAAGNDLWFEYSFLWNDTLYNRDNPANLAEIRMFGFRDSNNWGNYRGFYYLYLRDDNDPFHTSSDCPWRGHIDFSTYNIHFDPGQNCADDLSSLGNTLNGELIGRYIAGWGGEPEDSPYLWDANWQTMGGWHRLGYRYHQEVESVEGSTVSYAGYTELYIDGVLCWRVHSNFDPVHADSLVTHNLLLWTATAENGEITGYTDNDALMIEMRIDNITSSTQEVLIAIDDVRWTCGNGFAVNVVRVENPKPVEIELKEGLYDDGAMYFAKPGCVHEAENEWTVVKQATELEDGLQAKYCEHCGEQMETEVIPH